MRGARVGEKFQAADEKRAAMKKADTPFPTPTGDIYHIGHSRFF